MIKQRLWHAWARLGSISLFRVDAAIALTVGLIGVLHVASSGHGPPGHAPDWLLYLLAFALALPLAYRRRRPLEASLIVVVLALAYQFAERPPETTLEQMLPVMLGLYAVGNFESRRSKIAIVLLAGEILVVIAALMADDPWGEWLGNSMFLVASLTVGMAVRGRRERALEAVQRARDDAARLVSEERVRIARELHDVIAHSIATISVQAGMAIHVFHEQPDDALHALEDIRQISKDSLGELRATLNVLRSDNGQESNSPAPHVEQIGDLIQRAESAGVRVSYSISGDSRPLAPAIDLTVYRVVQESLTNVAKHAGPDTRAFVKLVYFRDAIDVSISDKGPVNGHVSQHSEVVGLGLVGMRERVASLGGEITTGPRDDGGYEVIARLPTGSKS